MKLNRILTLCAVAAALTFNVSTLLAQDDNNNNGNNGGQNGGGRRFRGGGGGGNFDPAQFQQRIMDNVKDQLGFTNDTDWGAVQPLVQKVLDAQRDVGVGGGMGRMFRNRRNRGGDENGGGGGGRRGGMFGQQANPDADALQKALDDNAPASQIKDLLAKYKASQKAKEQKLESAQDDLKKVLNTRQEASAYLLGLVRE